MKKIYLNTLTPEEIIKRLKDGEVVKRKTFHNNEIIYKMIDGIIVKEDEGCTTLNSCIAIDDHYFEEKEPFEITETGVYKTRDGQKAYVYKIFDDPEILYPVKYVVGKLDLSVNKFGRYSLMNETECDIVSEWED